MPMVQESQRADSGSNGVGEVGITSVRWGGLGVMERGLGLRMKIKMDLDLVLDLEK